MGGLSKKMPVTCWTFFIGVLAIAGFGIPGTQIGLGGFFSKDEILAVAYSRAFEWEPEKHVPAHDGSDSGHAEEHSQARDRKIEGSSDQGHERRVVLAQHHETSAGHESETPKTAAIFGRTAQLPAWMFYLALFTAYVTPFYMMRCWWMTFMGKPRDHHVYDHAHESPLMYIPLAVLAVGTVFASYFLFRPMINDAAGVATAAAGVLAIDGTSHTPAIHHAHDFLFYGVGFAFVVGFAIAIAIYWNGLGIARRIATFPLVRPVHILLEHKYYIDELYDLVFVQGTIVVAKICRFIDTWIVDFIFNLAGFATERLASFSGWVLDAQGIDGIYNGMSKTALDIGNAVRQPQTGRIRNYVLITAGVATVVLLALLIAYGGDREIVAAAVKRASNIE